MQEHLWTKTLLTPFSWLYGLITDLRNFLYDHSFFTSKKVSQYVISVGNLTVGGTGKTPVIEYLARYLLPVSSLAILSRGYGRNTKGFLLADEFSSASTIGDEPLQFYKKFDKRILVAVCENRVNGAIEIHRSNPEVKMLLLDDAFQHRAIRRDINLLLNDYNRPFYKDMPFPGGRLREPRSGAKRADAVIVTKCPENLSEQRKQGISKQITRYTKSDTPIFFAFTDYAAPQSYLATPVSLKKVKMVAGIADPAPFSAYLNTLFDVVEEVNFPDHHNYVLQDVDELVRDLKNDTFVVTTEKDMVKLRPLVERSGCAERFAYIPVTINFGHDTETFTQWLTGRLRDHSNTAER